MHLLERYALASGAKIDKPFVLEKFYPIPFKKYITVHPHSQFSSKNYDHWSEVLSLLTPHLKENGIDVVQIGTEHDPELLSCHRTSGQTSISQVAYIVKGAILHLGADSFPVHMASAYGKKIVALYGNSYVKNAYPFWGDTDNHVLLEPPRPTGHKPSFAAEENPKTINLISPQKIAASVLDLLEIKYDFKHETIYRGNLYSESNLVYETAMENVADMRNINAEKVLCRMDFNHNEDVLREQLKISKCEIVLEKPIDESILTENKNNMIGIIYRVTKNDNPDFARKIVELGVEIALVSDLPEEELDAKKINYMNTGLIRNISIPAPQENELKNVNLNKLYYKSNKFTFGNDSVFPSKYAWMKDLKTEHKDELSRVPDDKEFWKESNNFCFLLKTS